MPRLRRLRQPQRSHDRAARGACCVRGVWGDWYHPGMTSQKPAELDGRGVGRPLKFDNPKHLRKRIEAYFKECDREEDTRVFSHTGELLQEIPAIEKGKRVLRKRIVCPKCFNDLWE